jgi:hypothetical protein
MQDRSRRSWMWAGVLASSMLVACTETEESQGSAALAAGAVPSPAPAVVEPPRDPVPDGPPELVLEQAALHFGRIRENEVRRGQVRFSNGGGSVLRIADVRTTCGCTVASIPSRTLRPGESGYVEVSFDPSGPGAAQRKWVNIISNSGGESGHVTQVAIEADVEALVVIEPRILNIGVVPLGQGYRTFLDVGFLNETFSIARVNTTNPAVTARVLDERRTPPADSEAAQMEHGATIEVQVGTNAGWGNLFSWIEIQVSGRPSPGEAVTNHDARLRLQGQVFGEIMANPDTFRFGVEANTGFVREITLTHRDGLPFEVDVETMRFPGMEGSTVEIFRARPDQHVIILSGSGSPIERQYSGSVRLRTDVASEAVIELPIVGVVRQTPIPIGR